MREVPRLLDQTPASRRSRRATYDRGRICSVPGCATILSIYNASPYCAVHESKVASAAARRLASRPPVLVTCARDGCEESFLTTNPARKYCSDRCRAKAFQLRKRAA